MSAEPKTPDEAAAYWERRANVAWDQLDEEAGHRLTMRAEIDRLRAELARRDTMLTAAWPVVQAATTYADSTAEPTDTPHEDALLDAVAAYRAGGSAPRVQS
jgi:hypothetical protein